METPQCHRIAVFSFISRFLVFQSLKVDVLEYVVFCLVRTDRRIIQTKYSVIADFSMPIHAEILLGAMFVKSLFSQKDGTDGAVLVKWLIPIHFDLVFWIKM